MTNREMFAEYHDILTAEDASRWKKHHSYDAQGKLQSSNSLQYTLIKTEGNLSSTNLRKTKKSLKTKGPEK